MRIRILPFLFVLLLSKSFCQPYNNNGSVFFGTPTVHDIYLTFHQQNYWDSLVDGYNNDYYISCDVEIDGSSLPDCGAKFKGNSSYNNPSNKKSFKIDLNEFASGQKYDDLKKLNLNNGFKDPSFLREKMMLDFLNYRGLPAPRCTYARVYLNGAYWGLYTAVEEIDNTFLKNRFDDKKGNLFKGDPSGDLKWMGNAVSSYTGKYELHSNETLNNWTDLVQLIDKLNHTPTADLPDTLDRYFDLDTYYYTWATHILFGNLDSYAGSGHNYFIYHDSLINKFRFISWDVNEAFGNFNMGMNVTQMENLSAFFVPPPGGNRPLHELLLTNPSAKQKLADAFCDLVNYDFSIWNMEAVIDSLSDVIRPDVYADTLKFFTNADFENNINNNVTQGGGPGWTFPGIKSYLINRRNAIASELSSYGCTVGTNEINTSDIRLIIYPQPAENIIFFSGLPQHQQWKVQLFNETGALIKSEIINSNQLSLSSCLQSGIYFISISNNDHSVILNRKIIKL